MQCLGGPSGRRAQPLGRNRIEIARWVANAIRRFLLLRYNLVVGPVLRICLVAAALVACGGPQRASKGATLYKACAAELRWNGTACVSDEDALVTLSKATEALDAFDVDGALGLLHKARAEGPYGHALLITLYEKLGIAYSYLKKEEEALAAFEMLLALEPGHLLSYTLSPQATFLYERARKEAAARPKAQLGVSWPQGLAENDAIPLTIEVISDPLSMLHSMHLYVRDSEDTAYRRLEVALPSAGEISQVTLPPANTKKDSILELYGSAYDKQGNEVLLWFDAERPREMPLGYQPPTPWFRKWWVWAAIGTTAVATTGTTVYLLGLEPSANVGGGFSLGD